MIERESHVIAFRLWVDGKDLGVFPEAVRQELSRLEHLRGISFEEIWGSSPVSDFGES